MLICGRFNALICWHVNFPIINSIFSNTNVSNRKCWSCKYWIQNSADVLEQPHRRRPDRTGTPGDRPTQQTIIRILSYYKSTPCPWAAAERITIRASSVCPGQHRRGLKVAGTPTWNRNISTSCLRFSLSTLNDYLSQFIYDRPPGGLTRLVMFIWSTLTATGWERHWRDTGHRETPRNRKETP